MKRKPRILPVTSPLDRIVNLINEQITVLTAARDALIGSGRNVLNLVSATTLRKPARASKNTTKNKNKGKNKAFRPAQKPKTAKKAVRAKQIARTKKAIAPKKQILPAKQAAPKLLAKPATVPGPTASSPAPASSTTPAQLHEMRSAAAKKAWVTIRAKKAAQAANASHPKAA